MHTTEVRSIDGAVVVSGFEELGPKRRSLTDEITMSPEAAIETATDMILVALKFVKADERGAILDRLLASVQLSVFGPRTAESDALEGR